MGNSPAISPSFGTGQVTSKLTHCIWLSVVLAQVDVNKVDYISGRIEALNTAGIVTIFPDISPFSEYTMIKGQEQVMLSAGSELLLDGGQREKRVSCSF